MKTLKPFNFLHTYCGTVFCSAFIVLLLTIGVVSRSAAQVNYCKGEKVSLDAGQNYTGDIQWQQSTNGFSWFDIPGATTDPYTDTLENDIRYRAKITSGTCDPVYSDTMWIVVSNVDSTVQKNGVDFSTNTLNSVTVHGDLAFLAFAGASNVGTGSDGAYNSTGNNTLPSGTYNFTTFQLNAGHTLTFSGTSPVVIRATGAATINGTINVNGADGVSTDNNLLPGAGGAAANGGFAGGVGGDAIPPNTSATYHGADGMGAGGGQGGISEFVTANDGQGGGGGSYGTAGGNSFHFGGGGGTPGPVYGNLFISPLVGGSGGGGGAGDDDGSPGSSDGGGGGGAGGGAVKIVANSITLSGTGTITANGGTGGSCGNGGSGGGGSGGAIFLEAATITNNGTLSAAGGGSLTDQYANSIGGLGGDGRIRLNYTTLTGSGTITPMPLFEGPLGSESFVSSGSMMTPQINPGASLCIWGTVEVEYDMFPGTDLTVDVMDGAGVTVLANNIMPGTDLGTLPALAAVSSIRLRFNLSTTDPSASPVIRKWRLNYYVK